MIGYGSLRRLATLVASCWLAAGTAAWASGPDLAGLWFGYGSVPGLGGGTLEITFSDSWPTITAQTSIPVLGLFDEPLPVTIEEGEEGTVVTVVAPGLMELSGVIEGVTIEGELVVTVLGGAATGEWYAEKSRDQPFVPGPSPGPDCPDRSALYCTGSAEHCSELLPFLPESGDGYLNYPLNGETAENQYRSHLRRDLMQVVKYAAAMVACKAADWDYGNLEPLGLGDMSEADGSIPGTSVGSPSHPPGTHTDGEDIDIAYYQVYAEDNLLRAVGVHQTGPSEDAYHLLGPPYALDVWRTALFIAYLSEHPRIRVVGVDGKIGPELEEALDTLVRDSWIDHDLREAIHLAYEVEDTGQGWFLHHHHHMHVSMVPVRDLVSVAKIAPAVLARNSLGQYVTVHLELEEEWQAGQVDLQTVALILDGHTSLPTVPWLAELTDFNDNGIVDLTLKFDRKAMLDALEAGTVEVTIAGGVDGWPFQEVDTIRVLERLDPEPVLKTATSVVD